MAMDIGSGNDAVDSDQQMNSFSDMDRADDTGDDSKLYLPSTHTKI